MTDDDLPPRRSSGKRAERFVSADDESFYLKHGGVDKVAKLHYARRAAEMSEHAASEWRRADAAAAAEEDRMRRIRNWTVLTYKQVVAGLLVSLPETTEPVGHWQLLLWTQYGHYEHPSRRAGCVVPQTAEAKSFLKSIGRTAAMDKEVYLARLKKVYAGFQLEGFEASL